MPPHNAPQHTLQLTHGLHPLSVLEHMPAPFLGPWRSRPSQWVRPVWEGHRALCPCRDIFSQGFGPFRWVCTSGDPQDLAVTDQLATSVLEKVIAGGGKAVRLEMPEGPPGSAGQPPPPSPLSSFPSRPLWAGAQGFQSMPVSSASGSL